MISADQVLQFKRLALSRAFNLQGKIIP